MGAVAAASGHLGVHDLFDAEVADTYEVGAKSQFLDRRLSANLALYHTKSTNGYFFYFDSTTSTQNLGNLDATYKGAELELTAKATDRLDVYANFGYTDGKITRMEDPTVVGNKPPLLTKNYRQRRGSGTTSRSPTGSTALCGWTIRRSAVPGGTRTT